MIIQLTKENKDKLGTLKCIRQDGFCTWQPSTSFFALHDLIHYAVESTLGYTEAFLGMVASGRDLDEFGTRNGVKDKYTCEEAWAESIVGLLQWPGIAGGVDLSVDEFFRQLQAEFEGKACAPPTITTVQLNKIKHRIRELHNTWSQIEPGETMHLPFPDSTTG